MNGSTVLGVSNDEGQTAFTRRGDIRPNQNGDLALTTGQLVLNDGGGAIAVPQDQLLSISDEGVIYAIDPNDETTATVEIARLMLRDSSAVDLEKMEDGLFKVRGQRLEIFNRVLKRSRFLVASLKAALRTLWT